MSTTDPAKDVVVILRPEHFTESETVLVTFGGLTASTFRYSSDVAALRIANELGNVVLLPFQGQQIWDAEFLGRRLTMTSMFTEPAPTDDYLSHLRRFLHPLRRYRDGQPRPDGYPSAPWRAAQRALSRRAAYRRHATLTAPSWRSPASTATRSLSSHNYMAKPTVGLHADGSRVQARLDRPQSETHADGAHVPRAHQLPAGRRGVLVDVVSRSPGAIRIRPAAADASRCSAKAPRCSPRRSRSAPQTGTGPPDRPGACAFRGLPR